MRKTRYGLQEIRIHLTPFDQTIACVIGEFAAAEKYVAWQFDDPGYRTECANALAKTFERRDYPPIVWLPRPPRTPSEIGNLAHELLHAIRSIFLDSLAMPLTFETDETYCYALSYSVRTVLAATRRH